MYTNQALRNMTGYSQKDIEKINIEAIVHPDDLEDSKRRIKERKSVI